MDYGPVFLNRNCRKTKKADHQNYHRCFELATAVLYFSPIQHYGVTPDNLDQPAFVLDYLKNVPTTWDETTYIAGSPEDYVVIARRKANKWYVVAVNGKRFSQKVKVDLPMLAGKEAELIYDKTDGSAGSRRLKVKSNGKAELQLLPEGGAILISR